MLERVEQGARGSSYLLDEKYSRNQLSTRNTLEIALEPLSLCFHLSRYLVHMS